MAASVLAEQLSSLGGEGTYPPDIELARDAISPVHEIADQDEQDNEHIEEQWRLYEEVMAHNEEGLDAVPESDLA